MSNKSSCIICDSQSSQSLYSGIVKCKSCGYIYADLSMGQEEFEKLYNEGYFKGEEYSDYLSDKQIIQENFKNRLKSLFKFINNPKEKSLLEVGCAYGFFLEVATSFFKYVQGVDVTDEGVKYATNVLNQYAVKVDLENWNFNNLKFDVVCMWDTIEHLRRPDIYIKKISENMNRDGIIALTTGDIESFVARFRKNKWRLIHPPTHAHYFSKKSITSLLNKYGFDIIHFEHDGMYRGLDLILYNIFVLRWKMPKLYNFFKSTGITRIKLYFNLFDIMFVVAKKR